MHIQRREPASWDEVHRRDAQVRPMRRLVRRAGPGNNISMIIGFAVVATFIFSVSFFCFMRNRRLKAKDRTKYRQAPLSDPSDARRPQISSISAATGPTAAPIAATAAVDRSTSIRSIMTLPAYRPKAGDGERVLGREGERDGVDTVIELPSEQEIEDMRENEMESLYQIRLARRLELQEREERRRLRREARQNHDPVALRQLREQRREANERNLVTALREEHERIKTQQNRTVPSVAYANVGIARHDGSRVRGTSMESERVGLLSDAASISASMQSPGHTRNRSGSVMSVDSDTGVPGTPGRRISGVSATTRPSTSIHPSASSGDTSNSSSNNSIAPAAPPGYEDIPLSTTTTRHSVQTTASTIPTEPPPTYQHGKRSGADAEGGVTQVDALDGSAEASRQQQRANPTLQLQNLSIANVPQIVVQPSPTDLQRPGLGEGRPEAETEEEAGVDVAGRGAA